MAKATPLGTYWVSLVWQRQGEEKRYVIECRRTDTMADLHLALNERFGVPLNVELKMGICAIRHGLVRLDSIAGFHNMCEFSIGSGEEEFRMETHVRSGEALAPGKPQELAVVRAQLAPYEDAAVKRLVVVGKVKEELALQTFVEANKDETEARLALTG